MGKDKSILPNNDNTVFIAGYAKLPESITAEKLYKVIAVGLVVDVVTYEIVDCDCTLATDAGRNFFKKLTKGYSLKHGIEPLVQDFFDRYYGGSRKAIISALRNCYEKWLVFEQGNGHKSIL